MALKSNDNVKQGMVWFKSGHCYNFNYAKYQYDPNPTVIVLNAVKGVHPTTGNRHNYLQACNFTYIPLPLRRTFIKQWISNMKRHNNNVSLSWIDVQRRYPILELSIRRYHLDKGYIRNMVEITTDDMEKVVMQKKMVDFSGMAFMEVMRKNRAKSTQLLPMKADLEKIFGGKI